MFRGVSRRIGAAFAATLLGLVGLTLVGVRHLGHLADTSLQVAEGDAPAIAQLAIIRGRALEMRSSARDAIQSTPVRREQLQRLAAAADAERLLADHRGHHIDPHDGDGLVAAAQLSLSAPVREVYERLARGDTAGASAALDHTRESYVAFDRALEADIVLHSRDAHQQALGVHAALSHFISESLLLTVIGIAGALVLLWLGVKSMRLAVDSMAAQQRAAEERARELDDFAGRVAHDLRGPLTVMRVALGSAARSTDDRTRVALHRANGSIDVLNRMIEEMLEFARSGAKPRELASCNAASVVESVAHEIQDRARADRVSLVTSLSPGDAAIGELPLRMVTFNLLDNALKYIGDGLDRKVELTTRPEDGRILVEVRDTGVGISPAALPRLFDPFFRGQDTGHGYGLGLATVKRLVEAHGGCVAVESALGKGTVFKVSLPAASAPAA
jgi:signal transduction histidine kinase